MAGTPPPRGRWRNWGPALCEAHWAGRGRGSLPPLGEARQWHLTPARESGNSGKPGTSSAGPPDRWNNVNYTLFVHCLWPMINVWWTWNTIFPHLSLICLLPANNNPPTMTSQSYYLPTLFLLSTGLLKCWLKFLLCVNSIFSMDLFLVRRRPPTVVFTSTRLASTTWWYSWCLLRLSLNSDVQELPTEEKEGYLTRAILLMNNQPMVSIMMVMDVFLLRLLISGGGGGCQQRQAVNRSRHPRPSHAPIPISYSRSPVYNVAKLKVLHYQPIVLDVIFASPVLIVVTSLVQVK